MNIGLLFYRFMLIGLFTIGGGLVAIPLLQEFIHHFELLNDAEFLSMVAIAQSTPGSIGVNISTFVGFSQQGILGGVLTTFAFILPSMIIITAIAKFSPHFLEHPTVAKAFSGVRPAVAGIITAIALSLFMTVFNIDLSLSHLSFDALSFDKTTVLSVLLFTLILGLKSITKVPPPLLIAGAGIMGLLLF